MTHKEIITECFEDLRDDVISNVITDYSGRYMYGETCIAIVPEKDGFNSGLAIGRWLSKRYPDEAENIIDKLSNLHKDSFGTKTIIYFPRLKD